MNANAHFATYVEFMETNDDVCSLHWHAVC